MLQIGHTGGLCNRLDTITTGYVLARGRGEEEIEVIWPRNNQMPAVFGELFTGLPLGRVVECNVDPSVARNYHSLITSLPPNYRDSEFYTRMLARVVANAIPEIQAEVSAFAEEHFREAPAASTIGVHIRRLEPRVVAQELYGETFRQKSACTSPDLSVRQLCEFAEPLRYYEAMMRNFPETARFFISTDSQEAFTWLQARFGQRVFQRPKIYDDRVSVAGVREGLVDMLLLSRCGAVIGTGRSSFSHIAALAGRRPVVRVKTFPKVPADWPSFSRWRWVWSYRHFLVESTFWRRWLFFNVRPYAACVPRIPARCMRIARKYASRITTYYTPATTNPPPGSE